MKEIYIHYIVMGYCLGLFLSQLGETYILAGFGLLIIWSIIVRR